MYILKKILRRSLSAFLFVWGVFSSVSGSEDSITSVRFKNDYTFENCPKEIIRFVTTPLTVDEMVPLCQVSKWYNQQMTEQFKHRLPLEKHYFDFFKEQEAKKLLNLLKIAKRLDSLIRLSLENFSIGDENQKKTIYQPHSEALRLLKYGPISGLALVNLQPSKNNHLLMTKDEDQQEKPLARLKKFDVSRNNTTIFSDTGATLFCENYVTQLTHLKLDQQSTKILHKDLCTISKTRESSKIKEKKKFINLEKIQLVITDTEVEALILPSFLTSIQNTSLKHLVLFKDATVEGQQLNRHVLKEIIKYTFPLLTVLHFPISYSPDGHNAQYDAEEFLRQRTKYINLFCTKQFPKLEKLILDIYIKPDDMSAILKMCRNEYAIKNNQIHLVVSQEYSDQSD